MLVLYKITKESHLLYSKDQGLLLNLQGTASATDSITTEIV
jgi:hypothetical protein